MNHTDINRLSNNHPARQHPNWVVPYGGKLYYNPGIPEVKKFITEGALEIVQNYDIDALHMDDYFYPYKVAGEEFSIKKRTETYNNSGFTNIEDWRRNSVNELVKRFKYCYKTRKKISCVKFGISPFGVWRNMLTIRLALTQPQAKNYDDLYADTREWI